MNEQFLKRMESYIPDEIDAYKESLERPLYQGLRLNPLKSTAEQLEKELPFLKNKTPFSHDNWYVEGSYGNHPYHIEGRFYLQEPSASSVVEVLNVQPDDAVLDLCAAPGSKSTQIAGKLKDGFLVANEIMPKRAQILLSNLERIGMENMLVTNAQPAQICKAYPEAFDKILVDAPCSGEGMMKKHETAKEEWSLDNVLLCASRQKEILKEAIPALKPGGQMVYSTCTYAKEENEEIVAWVLREFPEMKQLPIDQNFGREGLPADGMDASLVRRIFPMDGGEGHFIARFEKEGEEKQSSLPEIKNEKPSKTVSAFLKEQMETPYPYIYTIPAKSGVQVYGMRHPFIKVPKGSVLRQGVLIGEEKNGRFEPAHSFYMSASIAREGKRKEEASLEQMDAFMHGQQLPLHAPKGYTALCYHGIPFGYGKSDGSRITNKIPKGLRLNPNSHVHE